MKEFLKNFYRCFFGNPVFPTVIVICSVFIVFLSADDFMEPKEELPIYTYDTEHPYFRAATAPATTTVTTTTTTTVTTSADTTKKTKSKKTTSAVSTEVTTTAAETTNTSSRPDTEPDENTSSEPEKEYQPPVYTYVSAGDSPNSDFYQDRLVIIGDSIAYGFNAYGYIPNEHNIAAESLGVWNINSYSFNVGGGSMNVYDAAEYLNSPLYYISIGMNDIYGYTPDDYAWNLRWIAEDILDRVPTATIVVGAITPVAERNYYTNNDTIREFNYALEDVINDMDTTQVLFFNTHDVLCDQNTMALGWDYSGGDGLHLGNAAYSQLLDCLFNFLDEYPVIEQINEHEGNNDSE